jgi:hypothetical protein
LTVEFCAAISIRFMRRPFVLSRPGERLLTGTTLGLSGGPDIH